MVLVAISVAGLLLVSFFSGMQLALKEANRLKLEIDRRKHGLKARILALVLDRADSFALTLRFWHMLAIVTFGLAAYSSSTSFLSALNQGVVPFVQALFFILSAIILAVLSELSSYYFVFANPNKTLGKSLYLLFVFYLISFPLLYVLSIVSKSRGNIAEDHSNHQSPGRQDLDSLLEHSRDDKTSQNRHILILQKALGFSDIKIRDCMVPRTEMVSIEAGKSIDELRKLFVDTGFSRVLVYETTIDKVIGYVHHSDLFKEPASIRQVVRPTLFVPDTMPARKLLSQLIVQHKNITIVVDEFGGTSGMVTIEDIMEEIFGEIYDEHDTSDLVAKQVNSGEYIFSGRLEIDFINEKYQLALPVSESYLTIAGLILEKYQDIPRANMTISIGRYQFQVLKINGNRIELVRVKIDTPKVEE